MKIFVLILFNFLVVDSIQSQTNIDTTGAMINLELTAKKMITYLHDKDYNNFAKYTHPKILSMIGGKAKMAEAIAASFKQIEDGGFTVDSVAIGEPADILMTKTELQDVVPEIIVMKSTKGKLIATSYLLAMSSDKGKTWYFIDTSGKTLQQMQTLFPELSNKLVIPAKQQPKFYNN